MSLEERQELGTQEMAITEGEGFYVGLSEPAGGEIVIGVELPVNLSPPPGPGHYVTVRADAVKARDIAAAFIELAEVLEGSK